jgi:hypothetical protein
MSDNTSDTMKHTPGPWKVSPGHAPGSFTVRRDSDIAEQYPVPVAEIWHNGDDIEANARLIAAAPTMLAMLKDIKEFLRQSGYNTSMIREVIAEAEGQ